MDKKLTLGSLFDGSGGFPLGALLNDIIPVWASEVEPFPIRVTTKRLPQVKHLGDICKINGAEIPPVDIITFGSPCTDMSVAGKRAGLDGTQSVLFYEAIRIIKEMRCETNGRYPRWVCWENVPGAFSSSKGEDFRAVLNEIAKIKDETLDVPMPDKNKWLSAGEIVGADYSIAWRTLDAQYFGVAQRRRRIYLVADFRDQCAGKVLFESEGLSGYNSQGGIPWQGTAGNVEKGIGEPSEHITCLNDQGGQRMDVTYNVTTTLRAEAHHPPCVLHSAGFCTEHSAKSRGIGFEDECSPTLRAGVVPAAVSVENHAADSRYKVNDEGLVQTLSSTMGTGGGNVPLVMGERLHGLPISENLAQTILATDYKGAQCVFEAVPKTLKIRSGCDGGGKGALVQDNMSATLSCNNEQTVFVPKAYGICSDGCNSMKSDNPNSGIYEADTSRTLDGTGGNPSCNQGGIAVVTAVGFDGYNSAVTDEVASTLGINCGMSSGKQGVLCAENSAVCIQGSMIGRDDKNGPNGDGVNEDVSFTLNCTDKHAVAYCLDRAAYNQGANAQFDISVQEELSQTIVAKGPNAVAQPASFYPQMKAESQCFRQDGKANTIVNGTNPGFQNGVIDPEYTVRRLTPTECALLQGFSTDWCKNLETPEPADAEVAWWSEVFETHRKIMGTSTKPKSRKQIIKWLKNPHSDSAEYKMWGNGVALPCVCFVLFGIVSFTQDTTE